MALLIRCFSLRSEGWIRGLVLVSAVAPLVLASSCGTAPDIDASKADPLPASDVGPLDVGAAAEQYDPPPLFSAIADGELDRVRDLLAGGEDVNQHDPLHGTPLIVALQMRQDDIVAALLAAGAKRDGTTAYFLTASNLPRRVQDPAVRAVADQFAESMALSLQMHEDLPALRLIEVAAARGQLLVDQHQADLMKQGWFLFRFAHDARRRKDLIGLLPTSEKYVVLAYLQTDGLNYNITTERIIDWLKWLETKDSLLSWKI